MNKIKQFLKKIEDFLYDLYEFDKHMKKVILFILIPVFSFGQDLVSSEDGIDIDLDFIGTTAGVDNLSKVQVNDTIMIGIDLNNQRAKDANATAATARQTSTSIPDQLPASSGLEKPGTPCDTPHCMKPFALTASSVVAACAPLTNIAIPAAADKIVLLIMNFSSPN